MIQSRLISTLLHKFSLLFTTIYIVIFFSNADPKKVFLALWMSLILSFGIAGIGYLINDHHDQEQDKQSGKANFFSQENRLKHIVQFLLFSACAIFPWFILPFDTVIFWGIVLEFVLFGLYSSPPFRLKERGLLGVITDALYAHVLPCMLAGYTFTKIVPGMSVISYHTFIFMGWLLLMGCRNILNHQLEDHDNDMLSGTRTVSTQLGKEKLQRLIHFLLIPAEGLAFIVFLWALPFPNEIVLFIYLLYIALYFIRRKSSGYYKFFYRPSAIPDKQQFAVFVNNNLMNEFYEIHYPVVLLAYFAYYQHYFILLFLLHLLLFLPMYVSFYFRK